MRPAGGGGQRCRRSSAYWAASGWARLGVRPIEGGCGGGGTPGWRTVYCGQLAGQSWRIEGACGGGECTPGTTARSRRDPWRTIATWRRDASAIWIYPSGCHRTQLRATPTASSAPPVLLSTLFIIKDTTIIRRESACGTALSNSSFLIRPWQAPDQFYFFSGGAKLVRGWFIFIHPLRFYLAERCPAVISLWTAAGRGFTIERGWHTGHVAALVHTLIELSRGVLVVDLGRESGGSVFWAKWWMKLWARAVCGPRDRMNETPVSLCEHKHTPTGDKIHKIPWHNLVLLADKVRGGELTPYSQSMSFSTNQLGASPTPILPFFRSAATHLKKRASEGSTHNARAEMLLTRLVAPARSRVCNRSDSRVAPVAYPRFLYAKKASIGLKIHVFF